MASQIVHDDDVAGLERGHERVLDIGMEAYAVDRAIEEDGRIDPVVAQSCQEGKGSPSTEGRFGKETFASGAAAMAAGHVGLGPGLVDEDQPPRIEPILIASPSRAAARHIRPILFGGVQRFF